MLKNTLKTTVLLAALGGLFVAIGGLLGGSSGATIGLLIALVVVGGSYWFSDKLALKAAAARIVTEQEAPELYRMVAGLAQKADLPMPVVAISPAPGGPCRRTGAWGAGRVDDGTQRDTPHSGYRTVYVSVAPADGPRSRFSKFTASVVVPRLVSLSA